MTMKLAQVVPVHSLGHGVYTVKASHKLPAINAHKTFASVWMTPRTLQRYNQLLSRWRVLHDGSFVLALILADVDLFVPAPIARPIAVAAVLLALPAILTTYLSLRCDMVVLVIKSFDFWYRGIALALGSLALAVQLRDARALTAITTISGNLAVLLVDANYRGVETAVAVLFGTALFMLLNAMVVAFGWRDAVHDITIVRVYGHTITARSIIVNSFGLSCLFFLHITYVRRSYDKASASQSLTTTTQCVLYRCRLRWEPVNSLSRLAVEKRDAKTSFQGDTIQLRCAGIRQVINARTTLLRRSTESHLGQYHWSLRLLLLINGMAGFVAMIATFALVVYDGDVASPIVYTLGILGFTATIFVNAFFIAFVYQVEMLRLLYTSFDFVFDFAQVSVAHLCLCDLSSWDERVYPVMSSLLWMHWACVIDAIPPIKRAQLGLNVRRVSALIQVVFLVALALFTTDLLQWHTQHFVNRNLLHDIGYRTSLGHQSANWSVGSIFLNRIAGLAMWTSRSLFHIVTYDGGELISLRGRVEYEDYEASKHWQRNESSKANLDAIVQALSDRNQRQVPPEQVIS